MIAAFIGVACAKWIPAAPVATPLAVSFSVYMMYQMHCLHPTAAATAMIAVLGGSEVHAIGWHFCYEEVAINAGIMVLLTIILNHLARGRHYPMLHQHHTHHTQFAQQSDPKLPVLNAAIASAGDYTLSINFPARQSPVQVYSSNSARKN